MKLTQLLAPLWLLFAFVSIRTVAAEVAQSPAPALLTWTGCQPDLSGTTPLGCGVARSVQTFDQSQPVTLNVEFRNASFTDPTSFCGAALLDTSELRYAEVYSWRDKGWSDAAVGWFVNENYRVGIWGLDHGGWHVGRVEWQPASTPSWRLTIDGQATTISYGQGKTKPPKAPKPPKSKKGQPQAPPPTTSPSSPVWPPNGEPPVGDLHVGLGYSDSTCFYRGLSVVIG